MSLDSGHTTWVLVSSALVLFMMIPGLALFYAGLVRTKNVLSVLMQCIALTSVLTLVWFVCGYSLAFDTTGMAVGETNLRSFIGGLGKAFLRGVGPGSLTNSIPEAAFFLFQLTFFVITPGLIVGAFAERMKFSALLAFSVAWSLLVYVPICHMTWSGAGGFFFDRGVFDFAGGIVVHLTAGIAALVACIVIGPREGYGRVQMLPHNLTMCFTGTAMLWVGWFGFNGGSALAGDGNAALAITATQISAASAATTWMVIEWVRRKPSVLGIATGAIGVVAGAVCYLAATSLKHRFGYDDSLDVFGVHGVGGFIGTVLAAVFASPVFGGKVEGHAILPQLGTQLFACLVAIVYTGAVSFGLLKAIDAWLGLRVDPETESRGLDLSLHEESGYNYQG